MKRTDFRCRERLRVRWAEIDAQHVVFNPHYLTYLDTAVAGYWRALALPYASTLASLGGELFVRKSTLEHHAPARFDDLVEVGVRCARLGTTSLTFAAAVFRGEERLVDGELVYVFADPATRIPRAVPEPLRAVLEGFERGEAMVEVRVGAWDELGVRAQALRTAVFVQEQRIPAELEWDPADATALHALALNRLGEPLATGRLLPHAAGVAKIGRMAVAAGLRGSGIGRRVLDALVDAARQRGAREVLLHAQLSAVPFYDRAGFEARGPVFEEAGIGHQEMVRRLDGAAATSPG